MDIKDIIKYLKEYDGAEIRLMEVCGTHTAAIFKNGIRSLISPKINLISGPGCPVCVTPTAYIDKCIEYAQRDNHVLLTFGDMLKVPGTKGSLSDKKGEGAKVQIMYSPFEVIEKAIENPEITYVVAAVGFETTAPAYGLMLMDAKEKGIKNIKVITALKTILPPLEWICDSQEQIDGFILPGHVSVIIGSEAYTSLAEKYNMPFVVAGFEGEHVLATIYDIVKKLESKDFKIDNLYKNAVKEKGNLKAQQVLDKVYQPGSASWRGLGIIENSGLYLKDEFAEYDGGSFGLDKDAELPKDCQCANVIVGRINPNQCPMFGEKCTPLNPYGPCMVSAEGACGIWFRNR